MSVILHLFEAVLDPSEAYCVSYSSYFPKQQQVEVMSAEMYANGGHQFITCRLAKTFYDSSPMKLDTGIKSMSSLGDNNMQLELSFLLIIVSKTGNPVTQILASMMYFKKHK